jgi:hypothetical protein
MKIGKNQIVKSVEKRIQYYQRCMAGTFILGILAGLSILCTKSLIAVTAWSGLQQIYVKIFFCFLIAATGIATGSAYRRRIRLLRVHRHKLLSDTRGQQPFTKPVREQFITEIQALFGMLFFLAAASLYIHCPILKLPFLLDCNLARLALIVGFLLLCRISLGLERKDPLFSLNPVQDYVKGLKSRGRVHRSRQDYPRAYIEAGRDFRKKESTQTPENRSAQSL